MRSVMENLIIAPGKYTPEIFFDSQNHALRISGESYSENVAEFYSPVFCWLEEYLHTVENQDIVFEIELIYFNSSSSKVLLDLFDMLELAVKEGKKIMINWIYDGEDEDALELGYEFKEDFKMLPFNIVPKRE